MLEWGGSQKASSPGSMGAAAAHTASTTRRQQGSGQGSSASVQNPDSTSVLHATANATKSCKMYQTGCTCASCYIGTAIDATCLPPDLARITTLADPD